MKAPYTERYVRCCERTAVSHRLLLDFPELWTCGYYLETFDFLAAVKENDKILEKFQALAKETHTVTVLPLPQKKGEDLYIGLYVIESDGRILAEYQKSFLWGREQNYGIMCVCNK